MARYKIKLDHNGLGFQQTAGRLLALTWGGAEKQYPL